MARARLIEYREGGFDPLFRRWLLLLYREPAVCNSAPPLARATLDVREDPDRPGELLVAVRGAARVTHDGREVDPLPATQAAQAAGAGPTAPGPAVRWAMSAAAKESSKRRRCPSCRRGGGLSEMADGRHKCRWCALVVEERAA